MTTLRYIDPVDCGCTDCITGRSIPLIEITRRHVLDLLAGRLIPRGMNSCDNDVAIVCDDVDLDVLVPLDDTLAAHLADPDQYATSRIAIARAEFYPITVRISDQVFEI